MRPPRLAAGICPLFCFCLLVVGCATESARTGGESVRNVDFKRAPQFTELAEHARQFGNEMYPQVCALLPDDGAKRPRQFDLIIQPLKSRNTGEARPEAGRIYLNSDYLTNSPDGWEHLDKVLVHEMTHLAEQYRSPRFLFWTHQEPASVFWGEGIANYAFYKLIGTNGWDCPECNVRYPHYTSGYTCAGAFLLFLEARYGADLVPQLNAVLRQRSYTDGFFTQATGLSLDELWKEFQKTSVFKPGAQAAFELQQALGYENGQPPANVRKRFHRYVKQHGDPFTQFAVKTASLDGKPIEDMRSLIATYVYLTQPGGSAENAWLELRKKGEAPGIVEGEKGSLTGHLNYDEMISWQYPQTRTLDVQKRNDPSVYHYTLTRMAPEDEWKLTKAWRAAADGKVVEEYPVP
jgi:Peptidase of plants and bacteria